MTMSVSTVPLPTAFFHPILRVLSEQPNGLRRRDLHEPVADVMGLTPAQRAEVLPSGAHFRYRHRLGWGLNMLKTAGYVESPSQGTWRITPKGKDLLGSSPSGFDEQATRRIVRESQIGTSGEAAHEEGSTGSTPTESEQTPEERIETAIAELRGTVAKELLQRISQASPTFFEELVLHLLHALGYGSTLEDLEHLGRSGDGGIDGVISLDKLGLEKVYVQAKRWQGQVGRPEVQAFYGALAGRRARKGVLITTSSFTREAREFAEQVSDSIVLINGARLSTLMIDHGVGVTHYRVIQLSRIDGDYFAEV
jgi:restriction system protein